MSKKNKNFNSHENEEARDELNEETIEEVCDEFEDETSGLKHENEELNKKIEELTKQADDYKDKWYRTAAEFDNFKKRNNETRRNAYDEGKTDTIKKILFVGDTVERALSYGLDEKTEEGMKLLLRQYGEILTNLGLEEINPVGEKFDPAIAEAIFTKDAEEGQESGTVESVFLKGYKLGGKIIRYAQVVVIK